MSMKLYKEVYEQLIKKNLEALKAIPDNIERQHIEDVLKDSINQYYPDKSANQWHNLRKNPNDLPKDGQRVIVKIGRSVCGLEYNENFAIYNDCNRKFWEIPPTGTWAIDTVNSDNNVVISWMELPEFKRE